MMMTIYCLFAISFAGFLMDLFFWRGEKESSLYRVDAWHVLNVSVACMENMEFLNLIICSSWESELEGAVAVGNGYNYHHSSQTLEIST